MDVDSSTKFIGSLTKFLQSLCNGYVEFQRGVELVGHIYLSIDTGEKIDYILHERVNKSDENSVTFVSNSFHAQPLADQDKNKTAAHKDTDKDKSGVRSSKDASDDDLMIVEQSRGEPGSTNSGTVPPRNIKRLSSSGSGQKQSHHVGGSSSHSHRHQGSINPLSSPSRNHQQGPSSTVTSQVSHQDNISIGDVKLEQLSTDELLSLATQVGEETSPTRASHLHDMINQQGAKLPVRRSSLGDTAGQPVWIKQEAPDDPHGGPSTGWSQGRDGQSDSSNSGSNLYPVMMHPNAAAFSSSPVFPGFPSMSGPSASATSQHHASGQPLPGTSGGGHPYSHPMMGSSHNMSGIDPAAWAAVKRGIRPNELSSTTASTTSVCRNTHYSRLYRQRLKQDPVRYREYLEKQLDHVRRYKAKKKTKQM